MAHRGFNDFADVNFEQICREIRTRRKERNQKRKRGRTRRGGILHYWGKGGKRPAEDLRLRM